MAFIGLTGAFVVAAVVFLKGDPPTRGFTLAGFTGITLAETGVLPGLVDATAAAGHLLAGVA